MNLQALNNRSMAFKEVCFNQATLLLANKTIFTYQLKTMKQFVLTLIFSLAIGWGFANTIDSLHSDQQVLDFVVRLDKRFRSSENVKMTIQPTDTLVKKLDCQGIAKQWNIRSWEKADFNHDDKTDLLVYVYWYNQFYLFTVMDNGNNTFKTLWLTKDHYEPCQLAKPVMVENQQFLLYYARKHRMKSMTEFIDTSTIDTLVYMKGNFVELNRKPAKYHIKSIKFRTSGCFGTCPIFELNIAADGTAKYVAEGYNPKQGSFKGKLSPNRLQELLSLINYINIKKLQDNYQVNWTDDQTGNLSIQFTDGSTKSIRDYGMQGTFGLSLLYNMLSALRESETWHN
ncbi:hypothetical protein KHS38_05340 [Mucilaginibacter sp. Bleaf8]|uniref:DUF6438 domain-containing protein n=1 Tax=Mucilaginibacter sp. Bleaf8 TaxID=2834430 RepID=UPI001BCCC544|nr:DUF6438 domain-containing protein [Mucilaginibacter sp. Bleaf8]MBS7563820.1 hypothetical protein [Mucilaginibacter sp. Bleaf8]